MSTVTKKRHLRLVHDADTEPHKGTCSRCGHTEFADGYDATYQALMRHWHAEHLTPPTLDPATRWPWRGKANKTQAGLLKMAERGELRAYLCHVVNLAHAPTTVNLDPIMSNPDAETPWSEWKWYPRNVTGWQRNYLPGLIAAKLILPPKPPTERQRAVRAESRYRITPTGRAVLQTAPLQADS